MAQQGRPTSREPLGGLGAPPGMGCPGAAVPDVCSFVPTMVTVNAVTGTMRQMRPNRDLASRRTVASLGRHAGGRHLILMAASAAKGTVTACAVGAAEHPIVAISAASTSDVIDRQYREIGCCPQSGAGVSRWCSDIEGRTGSGAPRWWSLAGGRTGGGSSRWWARIGVDMPQMCAVAIGRRPDAAADRAPETASARPTTGVDAA